MGNINKKVELLSPAGSYEIFKAVINAGADAVYLAGNKFGARAYAGNLSDEELLKAIRYSKLHNKKLYLTVNTLLKNTELKKELYDYIRPLYEEGLDAVIVQDFGVMKYLNECFPKLDIHASTQMTITSHRFANMIKKYNVTRIVPARELSLDELKELRAGTDLEIETFVHGALCYSYSGQCFFSSFIGGRSGNRGRCAGPCRLCYEMDGITSSMFSLKDLNTLKILPDIIEAGVYSLKIEGRMKSVEYAAGVSAIYRKYIDKYLKSGREGYRIDEEDEKNLLLLFDRGGNTTGYYQMHNGAEMIADESKTDKDFDFKKKYEESIVQKFVSKDTGLPVNITVTITSNEQSTMSVYDDTTYVTVNGQAASKAISKELTKEAVIKQIDKLGNTFYRALNIDVFLDDDVFLTVKDLNELRRNAIEEFTKEKLSKYRRNDSCFLPETTNVYNSCFEGLSVRVLTKKQADTVLKYDIKRLIINTEIMSKDEILDTIRLCRNKSTDCYIGFPRVERKGMNFVNDNLSDFINAGIKGFLIRNIAQIDILKDFNNIDIISDYNNYVFNDKAAEVVKEFLVSGITYPVELNKNELKHLNVYNSELMVYGYLPLMISANCVDKTHKKCHALDSSFTMVKDRKKANMPVLTCCRYCYNIIYNSVPLYLLDKKDEIEAINPSYLGIEFTMEKEDEIIRIMDNNESTRPDNFTRGHFSRGVE